MVRVVKLSTLNELMKDVWGQLVLVKNDRREYRSERNGLKVYVDTTNKVIQFEIQFGRIDGRNELLKELRYMLCRELVCEGDDNSWCSGCSALKYSCGIYEDQLFVYNGLSFEMYDATMADDNEWSNKVLMYSEYVYDYSKKKVVEYEAMCWYGSISVHVYHSQTNEWFYNMIVNKCDENVFREFLSELNELNDVMCLKSCSTSSLGCFIVEDINGYSESRRIRVADVGDGYGSQMISNIACSKRTKGVYGIRKELIELIQKYKVN